MQINLIKCKTNEEEQEIIKLLKEKYKNNRNCKFREISDTFILPDKKWIIVNEYWAKQFFKKDKSKKIFSAEVIKNALCKN